MLKKMLHPAVLKELKRLWKLEKPSSKRGNDFDAQEVHERNQSLQDSLWSSTLK